MDNGRLSRQVEDDLEPLFTPLRTEHSCLAAGHSVESGSRRSLQPLFGGVVAAALCGVAISTLIFAPRLEPSAPAEAETAPIRLLSLQSVEAAPDLRGSVSPNAVEVADVAPAPTESHRERPKTSAALALPQQIAIAQAPSVPLSRPQSGTLQPLAPPSRPEAVQLAEREPDQRCLDTDEACLASDVAEADRLLAYAYRQAWQAGVPTARLRAVQRSWGPGRGFAAEDTNKARLDAYEVRTRDVWALIERQQADGPDR